MTLVEKIMVGSIVTILIAGIMSFGALVWLIGQ